MTSNNAQGSDPMPLVNAEHPPTPNLGILMRTFDARVESVLGHRGLPTSKSESASASASASLLASAKSPEATPSERMHKPQVGVLEQVSMHANDVQSTLADTQHAASVLNGAEATRQRYLQYGKTQPAPTTQARAIGPATMETDVAKSKSKQSQRANDFLRVSGGLPLLIAAPVLVFIFSIIILYSAAPIFVRKRPKSDYELAEVDNIRVIIISASCAAATLAITVAWSAIRYASGNRKL